MIVLDTNDLPNSSPLGASIQAAMSGFKSTNKPSDASRRA